MIAPPFEKTYLSRAQSRIWSMDNPVGDPFGGPAYGQKEEPVSMIAAVVAIGAGAGAVATATTTLAMVMGGLMIAGGAASLIGTVSGNKKLAMIGGIVAGVGGLGLGAANMLADSAATATATSVAAEGTSEAASSGLIDAIPDPQFGAEATANVAAPASGLQDAIPDVASNVTGEFNQPVAGDLSTQNLAAEQASSANNGLIKSALDTSAAGDVANITPQSLNPVDDLTNEMTAQFANAAENPLQPSPYESLADASGNTQLVPKPEMSSFQNGDGSLRGISEVDRAALTQEGLKNAQTNWPTAPTPEDPFQAGVGSLKGITEEQRALITKQGLENAKSNWPTDPTGGSESTSWLDKVEGIAKGIEKYKTTAMLGGNLISGAMRYAVPSQVDQATIAAYNAKANLANAEANAIAAAEDRRRRNNEAIRNLKPVQLNNASNPIFNGALSGAGIINSARA